MTPLILASGSPRRRQLLELLGLAFRICPAEIEEVPLTGEAPEVFVRRAAREKALEVARTEHGVAVLGADTVVEVDGAILGKPNSTAEAERMLRVLSGREHKVHTAVALALPGISHQDPSRGRRGAVPSAVFDPRGAESYSTVRRVPRGEKTPLGAVHRRPQQEAGEICGLDRSCCDLVDTARVRFVELNDRVIRWYVATGEPRDKAGAYAVQGLGGLLVAGIEGSPHTVVGLPIHRLAELFEASGLDFWSRL